VADSLERLSLFVGPGKPITDDAVAEVVTRVRHASVWELMDAISARRLDRALAVLADVYDPRDGGLPVLGAIAWSVRQMVKFDAALKAGVDFNEAAKRAGVAPFKARDVAQVLRQIPPGTIERWLALLAETDLALKSSRRPGNAVLEALVIAMGR
jgi:DNA polymerase-3 subunit delta